VGLTLFFSMQTYHFSDLEKDIFNNIYARIV
jgi:hypothetical protein